MVGSVECRVESHYGLGFLDALGADGFPARFMCVMIAAVVSGSLAACSLRWDKGCRRVILGEELELIL